MLRRRTTQVLGLLAAAMALVALTAPPLAAGLVVVNPNATVIVSDLSPVQSRHDHGAERDEQRLHLHRRHRSGVRGGPAPGDLSQRVTTPDTNGDWQVTVYFPFAGEWPSNYVLGPFKILRTASPSRAPGRGAEHAGVRLRTGGRGPRGARPDPGADDTRSNNFVNDRTPELDDVDHGTPYDNVDDDTRRDGTGHRGEGSPGRAITRVSRRIR